MTDEEIISAFNNGDEEAFKELVNRYTTPLYNFTARLAGAQNAPDIVQDTFVKAWKNLERFDAKKANFKTWIFTIARNTVTDLLRKKKSLLFSDIKTAEETDIDSYAQNIPDEELLPDELLAKADEEKILHGMLDKLNPEYQEVLILHYQEEMTFDEISKVLGKSLNTVKSQNRRAILTLRKLL